MSWRDIFRDGAEDGIVFDEALVKVSTGQFDVEMVERLRLPHLNIRSIDSIGMCVNLRDLTLSCNRLRSLAAVGSLAQLQRLDVSFNMIVSLEGVSELRKLEVLRLQGNLIERMDVVVGLASVSTLRSLFLRDYDGKNANPVCTACPDYLAQTNAQLPMLRCLDGHYFCKESTNPFRIDAGDDDEISLPPSKPWVDAAFFRSCSWDGTKAGSAAEKNFYGVAAECKSLAMQAVESTKKIN